MSITGLVTGGWFCQRREVSVTQSIAGLEAQIQPVDLITAQIELLEGVKATVVELESVSVVPENLEEVTATLTVIDDLTAELAPVVVKTEAEPEEGTISTFTTSPTLFEIGQQVVTPVFTASYSTPPTQVILTDSEGTPGKDVSSTPNSFNSDGTFQKNANNGSVTFTLSADFPVGSDTANRVITWQPRTFWGVGGATLLTETEIEALANNALDANFARVFTIGPMGPSEYVWYCFPQSYDPGDNAQFQVGPFIGGFLKVGVVSVTNSFSVTQDYACWRSDFPGLDQITVMVF